MSTWGLVGLIFVSGCGTTRSSDTSRTATEQLLISDAVDRAVQTIDFQPLANQTIYLDDSRLSNAVDRDYVVSTLRQHLLASGCTLKDKRDEADFVVEARAGAIGTDRNDLLFGIPATNVPQILPLQGMPAAIPEVPLAKRRDQRGIAKISMFAYHRESGLPVWQSGVAMRESSSNDVWIFGAGPFQHGTVYNAPLLAKQKAARRLPDVSQASADAGAVNVTQEATFASAASLAEKFRRTAQSKLAEAAPKQTDENIKPAVAVADASPKPPADKDEKIAVLAPIGDVPPKKEPARLTGGILDAQRLRAHSSKTVEAVPHRERASIGLPQPRFESL